jgi:hypothetical protein
MIKVSEHRELIDSIFERYDLSASCYEIVPDVREWCEKNGISETNPFRGAKCLCRASNGTFHILFKEEQSDEMISCAKSTMELYGFVNEVKKLDSDLKYLEHLILHEISCKLLNETEQKPRDEWAFKEMGII